MFLPAAPKESVHLRKLLKGIQSALSGVAWTLSPVPVPIAAPNQVLREGHNARMWRVTLSKDHCMWCPARRCFLLVPGTRAKTPERSPIQSMPGMCHRAGGKPQKQQESTVEEAVRSIVCIFTRGSVTITFDRLSSRSETKLP